MCVHGIAVFYRRRFRLVFGFISTAIDVFVLLGDDSKLMDSGLLSGDDVS